VTNSNSVLKSSAHRSTRTGGEGDDEVRKLFHSKGWRRLGDRRRAEREYRQLQLAFTAGLPVPRPLGLNREPAGWCLSMERIANARSLASVLLEQPERVRDEHGEQLGRLLAQLTHLRLRHGDLHPGNLLLDDTGKLWLVDFGQARVVDTRDESDELVTLLASLRERSSLALRDALVRTYFEFVPSARGLASPRTLARAARRARRSTVQRNLDRWTRTSGVAEEHTRAGQHEVRALREPDAHSTRLLIEGEQARRAWLTAARLFEHNVPVLAPVCLFTKPERAAEFELPEGVVPVAEAARDGLQFARSYGTLLGTLHDRGLQLNSSFEPLVLVAPSGQLLLHPLALLTELDLTDEPTELQSPSFLTEAARATFEASSRAAFRDAPHDTGAPTP